MWRSAAKTKKQKRISSAALPPCSTMRYGTMVAVTPSQALAYFWSTGSPHSTTDRDIMGVRTSGLCVPHIYSLKGKPPSHLSLMPLRAIFHYSWLNLAKRDRFFHFGHTYC